MRFHFLHPCVAFFQLLIYALATSGALAQPSLTCVEPEYSFGELYSDESVLHEYIFENSGTETLELKQPQAQCGCTTATLDRSTLAPGETAILTAIVDLQGKRGPQRLGIDVDSNDPAQPTLSLALTGNVMPLFYVDNTMVDFAVVPAGVLQTQFLRLLCARETKEFGVKDIHIPKGLPLRATFARASDGPNSFEVELVLDAAGYRGYFADTIYIHTNQPGEPLIPVAVSGEIWHEIRIEPSTLAVSASRDSRAPAPSLYLRVLPGTEKHFSIKEVVPPLESINSEIFPAEDGSYLIQLTELPPASELVGKHIVIATDLTKDSRVEVPIEVIARP